MAFLALGKLGGDEFGGGALHDFLVEAGDEFIIERAVAGQESGFQNGGADRHVGTGLADRLVDRARGMADLQPHIPQAIEDRFGNLLAPRRLLVGQDEEQIDVGLRRHQSAAIAAGGDHRHPLRVRRRRKMIEMPGRGVEQDADDLVLHKT